jgi:hypothetical protein
LKIQKIKLKAKGIYMLLLNENEISLEIKPILDNILDQLTEVSSIVKKDGLKDYGNLKNVSQFCDDILTNANPIIFLETFFSNNGDWRIEKKLETLSSLLSLSTKDIKALETQYSIKYPKQFNVTKKDVEILNETLALTLIENVSEMPELKALTKFKAIGCHLNLTNHLLKKCKPTHDKNLGGFVKKLQSKVLSNPSISMDYFNKYFNLEPMDIDFDSIEKVSGVAVISSVLAKGKQEKILNQMINLNKLEQISFKDVLKLGVIFNMDQAKYYHFFKSDEVVYSLSKDRPIIDTTIEELRTRPIVGKHKNGYSDMEADLSIRIDKLPQSSYNQAHLDYEGLQKIRTAMFVKRPKWSVGSVLKQGNSFYYVANDLTAMDNGDFKLQAVVVNPEYKTEYFIRNDIVINKNNCQNFELADKIDGLLFFEAVNSAFQHAETKKLNNELYQTMQKRFGY